MQKFSSASIVVSVKEHKVVKIINKSRASCYCVFRVFSRVLSVRYVPSPKIGEAAETLRKPARHMKSQQVGRNTRRRAQRGLTCR